MPKIKNIIIFIIIAAIFVLIYMYFIKKSPDTPALVSSSPSSTTSNTADTGTSPSADSSLVTQNFLNLLLSVKNISLKDTIFSDEAFISLHDCSITLIPDGNEGRVNPLAPLGTDAVATGVSTTP